MLDHMGVTHEQLKADALENAPEKDGVSMTTTFAFIPADVKNEFAGRRFD